MNPAEPRRVLIATVWMTTASGTVTYTRDLALALLRLGWLPIVYTTRAGEQAEALRHATIPVVTSLSSLGEAPDVIHGHHALETLAALARFPDVPALFVCHDARTWHSIPPRSPRLRTIVAVDRNCRDRVVFEHGVPSASVSILANMVDLQRFLPRPPLPAKPRRALVFSNLATESSFVAPIREACAQRGIDLDVIGQASGRATDDPETVLPGYDLVFAKARCAIEAAAVGTAVIGCDADGMAGMITTKEFDAMRELNFGRRTLQLPVTRETVLREIDRYDPVDAAAVSSRIRTLNDAELIARQFIALYEKLLLEPVRSGPEEMRSMSESLERLARQLDEQTGGGTAERKGVSALLKSTVRRLMPRFRKQARG